MPSSYCHIRTPHTKRTAPDTLRSRSFVRYGTNPLLGKPRPRQGGQGRAGERTDEEDPDVGQGLSPREERRAERAGRVDGGAGQVDAYEMYQDEGKADRDKSENTILKYSYHYLMSNAFLIDKNKAKAKEYAEKILAIDPEYAPAQQIKDLK